ncbi:MAG TPA: hypothetical protein VM490_02565 [Armatimonadaceae bacterium]|nr:hypothetical protein [Armatimonadaceae bacterium]
MQEEIEQRIGRNLLTFQRIEGWLKQLAVFSRIDSYAHDLARFRREKCEAVETRTMGHLVGQLNGDVLSGPVEQSVPDALTNTFVTIGFSADYPELRASLSALVAERNDLVHHFLARHDLTTPDGTAAAVDSLDRQYERAQQVLNELKALNEQRSGMVRQIIDFLESDAGIRYLDLWFGHGRRITGLLQEVAREKADPEGWTDLGAAGQAIRQQASEDLTALKARYRQKTLKGLLQATGWFDVRAVPGPKGAVPVQYRMRTEQTWQIVNHPAA